MLDGYLVRPSFRSLGLRGLAIHKSVIPNLPRIALSIMLWRQVLREKGRTGSEPLSGFGSLFRKAAGD